MYDIFCHLGMILWDVWTIAIFEVSEMVDQVGLNVWLKRKQSKLQVLGVLFTRRSTSLQAHALPPLRWRGAAIGLWRQRLGRGTPGGHSDAPGSRGGWAGAGVVLWPRALVELQARERQQLPEVAPESGAARRDSFVASTIPFFSDVYFWGWPQ